MFNSDLLFYPTDSTREIIYFTDNTGDRLDSQNALLILTYMRALIFYVVSNYVSLMVTVNSQAVSALI